MRISKARCEGLKIVLMLPFNHKGRAPYANSALAPIVDDIGKSTAPFRFNGLREVNSQRTP